MNTIILSKLIAAYLTGVLLPMHYPYIVDSVPRELL